MEADRAAQTGSLGCRDLGARTPLNVSYDKVGNILTWTQQTEAEAKQYEFGYDQADQLTAAILKSTDPTPQVLKRYYYAYDPAGNRTAEQIDDATTGASYNNMNQLVSQQAGGTL